MWRPEDQYGTGTVWHRRRAPRDHAFAYRLWFSLLDVDRLDERFARSRLWSRGRFGLVRFRRADYFRPEVASLGDAVRDRIERELGERPGGPIRMLTHLRQWGLCFNPVTFYFAHRADGALLAILAEVHNTPWGERHAYVLDARDRTGPTYRFGFAKAFHVSPFLPMDMDYDWTFTLEDQRVVVHMRVTRGGQDFFQAGMRLALAELDPAAMRRLPLTFPLQAVKVAGGIYWQALRLYVKRIPFHDHPRTHADGSGDRRDER
ncbi:DUF1365 domain-containing protein [Wenzhouxiangella sp. XN79A]|uniref:DUF1365 domain-containing protein n=1 Tax=Wenzhouxiangella sp. XN79A TaxID=2724193 RepID=UPI00144AC85A|nr:DUF1365 domain-containing protein [Wenzhouxiangella sp. XN79A]NKI34433.1 DUF1365 domain-containing protein [Wenzhouxiangella sp. XN79A]